MEVGHELFYRIKEAGKSEELQKKEMSILHYSNREVQSMRMESGSNLGNSEKKITIHITWISTEIIHIWLLDECKGASKNKYLPI